QQQSSSVSFGFVSNMLNPSPDTGIDSIFNLDTESTSLINVSVTTIVEPHYLSATTLPPPPTSLITHLQQTPVPTPATVPSSSLHDLPNFGSLFGFDHRLKALEDDFLEFKQKNQFAEAVSLIPDIVDTFLANKLNEAIKTVVQLQSDKLRDEAQAENEDFINKLDENIKKIIKEQVKEQTSHVVAANLSELELKRILINKMERNKSIHRSDEQKNLYKALVDAYESNKLILDTYGDIVTIKRRRDDHNEGEEPFAGSNQGSKRRRAGKEPKSTSAPKEKTSKSTGKSKEGSKSHQEHTGKLKVDTLTPELLAGPTFELLKGSCKSLVELEYFLEEVCKATTDKLDWNNPKVQQYPHDLCKPLPLIPNSRDRQVIPFEHFINNDLAYLSGGVSSQIYTTSLIKTKAADYGHIKWIEVLVPNAMWSQVPVSYDKHALWGISHWGRKRHQRHAAFLVQGKLTNLIVEERLAFNVSLRMFTRSIVIQRRVEDLQLGVESYQKKLNLIKPDTYRSNLKRKKAYTVYSSPRSFIYQNKDKKNRLMRINELHKFSNGTLNDVRTTLDDRLKGILMKYLPQTIWRQSDRDKAGAMI
nr:hypothetical protein [Tanacetum cinerariifolium]